ncbi:hypothetical protein NEMIN01_0320 [Nematocida minor]|uniref:uncharacterized protein n=1 Tax=Nematocida minor TaxID=1912983 RepID=UPI00221ECCC3|nr:uncharacterized protein NEMIN01_0320 [Nematocida minor]KAI5189154.1 hypothetical protein NEMIN01_0320 [Nematocida minor]
MEHQKLRRLLNAIGIALISFTTHCKGSWNVFDEKYLLYDGVDQNIEKNDLEGPKAGEPMQAGTEVESVSNPTLNIPGVLDERDITENEDLYFQSTQLSPPLDWHAFEEQMRTREQFVQQQCISQYGEDLNASSERENSLDVTENGHRIMNEEDLDLDDIVLEQNTYNIWDLSKSVEELIDMYGVFTQAEQDSSVAGIFSSPIEENNSSSPRIGEKRKADSFIFHPAPERKKEEAQKNQPQMFKERALSPKKKNIRIEHLDIELWSDVRLTNKRRESRNLHHETVYSLSSDNFDEYINSETTKYLYQESIREYIKIFSEDVTHQIDQNAVWYFIACRSTNVITKNRDLLWLDRLIKEENEDEHKKMVEKFDGYYPHVFEDMLAYVEKYKPLRVIYRCPPTEWNETLGDIYMRKDLDLNCWMVVGQDKISQVDSEYSALSYAMRMILALPEVHQDFSNINTNLIKATQIYDDASRNEQTREVLLDIHKLAEEVTCNDEKIENMCENIYSAIESIYNKNKKQELSVPELYKNIYTILADFYEKVAVIDENKYILVGKYAIKHQRYARCKTIIVLNKKDSSIQIYGFTYSFEINTWSILPVIKSHYHVYYVDNTEKWPRRLCMPMYKNNDNDKGYYLHTIDDIVNHVKELFRIQKDTVHPFKVRKDTKEWSYIKKDERKITVKELPKYQVVFYRIDEDLATTEFKFAEFEPLVPHIEKSITLPLFLTRQMLDAEDLGPFVKEGVHAELNLLNLKSAMTPNQYKFNKKYEKEEYSNVHGYYRNLYIPPDDEKRKTADCYIMNYQSASRGSTIEVEWYVNMMENESAYMHCQVNEKFKEKKNSEKLNNFVSILESREHNKDSELQGIWLKNSNVTDDGLEKIHMWRINDQEEKKSKKSKEKIEEKLRKAEERYGKADERFNNANNELKKLKEIKELGKQEELERRILEIKREKSAANSGKSRARICLKSLQKEIYEEFSEKPDGQLEFIVFHNVNKSKSNLGAHNEILDVLISGYEPKRNYSKNK